MNKINTPLVIVANGEFPKNKIPLKILKSAKYIISCDGATDKLLKNGFEPNRIIGDLDSISVKSKDKYHHIIIKTPNQSENDLRKAINYVLKNNINKFSILASTGNRDDHTLGNIFSLFKYNDSDITIYTESGTFKLMNDKEKKFNSFFNQDVSIFSIDKSIKISSKNLKYNFNKNTLSTLFYGTLNKSLSDFFTLSISHGNLLIYQSYNEN